MTNEDDQILSEEDFKSLIIESFLQSQNINKSNIHDTSDWQPVSFVYYWTGDLFEN
jgi:hypothetical protein